MNKFLDIKEILTGIRERLGHNIVISVGIVDERLSMVFSFHRATGLGSLPVQTLNFDEEDFETPMEEVINFIVDAIEGVIVQHQQEGT